MSQLIIFFQYYVLMMCFFVVFAIVNKVLEFLCDTFPSFNFAHNKLVYKITGCDLDEERMKRYDANYKAGDQYKKNWGKGCKVK